MGTDREADKMKIKQILTATVVSLCNNGLSFDSELCVEGLLGITLDKKEVLLVNIKETINGTMKKKLKPAESQSQSVRLTQTAPSKQQQQQQQQKQQLQQQQQAQQQFQQQQFQQQQQQTQQKKSQQKFRKPPHAVQEQPRTPGRSSSSATQDAFSHGKAEPLIPKVMSESQTQCMAVQPHGGYAQVQKSVKMVQNAQGVVEQKQMEWKTYAADGRVVGHKKVHEVQTVAPSGMSPQGGYAGDGDISGTMPGYQTSGIKVEPGYEAADQIYEQHDPSVYYDEQEYGDYGSVEDAYNAGQVPYSDVEYQIPGQQFDPGMDPMSDMYHQGAGASRGRGAGLKKPPAKRAKRDRTAAGKVPPIKKAMKSQMGRGVDASASRSTPTKAASKDVNSSLVQRALDMVNEGKMSAATAINLFGIPKSTFYKKLATSGAEKGQQFMDEVDFDGMEEAWDEGMQDTYDPMDPAFANYGT